MEAWFGEHLGSAAALAVAAVLSLIQVSPIRLNPWTALARAIGRAINGDLARGVADMRDSMDRHIKMDDERYAKQCRLRILRFNDEILQAKKHTKEHFDETLDDITEYERYCETHPGYRNSKAGMAIENIKKVYQKCLADKDFL